MTPRLPSLTPKQIISILERHGFLLNRVTGSHYIFYNPATKCRVTVPYHARDLPRGTVMSILRQSGVDRDVFIT